jgi:hypothetical protein
VRDADVLSSQPLTAAEVRQVIDQYAEKINENRSADRIDNNLNINEWLGN